MIFRSIKMTLLVIFFTAFYPVLIAQSPGLPESIRMVTLKGPTGMGMFSLIEKGYLDMGGGKKIRLDIEVAGTPEIADSRMIASQADFCTMPINQAAKLYNKGVAIQLGGVNVWGVLYLVSTEISSVGPDAWKQLKGTTVYSTGKGASPDSVFRTMAEKHGLDPEKDLTLDYRFNQMQLATMMIEGQIKTAFLPEPFATRVLEGTPAARIVIDMQKEWAAAFGGARIAQGGIVVSKEFARTWPQVTKALLDAYRESTQQAIVAPDAPDRIGKLGLGIDARSFALSRARMNLEYGSARESRKDVMLYLERLFVHNPADTGGKLPDEGFFFQ